MSGAGKSKKPAKMGRPTVFTEEIAHTILQYVQDGESLRYICDQNGMPDRETVRTWLRTRKDFLGQYAQAKDEQADFYADTISEIAKGTLRGAYEPNAARVAIDAYKWTASKLKPRKYGDKLDVTSDGEKVMPIIQVGAQYTKRDIQDGEIVDNDQSSEVAKSVPNHGFIPSSTPQTTQNSGNIINDIN